MGEGLIMLGDSLVWLWRRVTCRHRRYFFVRNIYGDEIILANWKRSIWRCELCGREKFQERLVDAETIRARCALPDPPKENPDGSSR